MNKALGDAYEALEDSAKATANAVALYNVTHDEKHYKRVQIMQHILEEHQNKLEIEFHAVFRNNGVEDKKAWDMARCAADSAAHTLLKKAHSEIHYA